MAAKLRKFIVALAVSALLLIMMLPTVSASILADGSPAADGNDQQDCTPRQVMYEMLVYAYGGARIQAVSSNGAALCVTAEQASAMTGQPADDSLVRVTSGVLPAPPKF